MYPKVYKPMKKRFKYKVQIDINDIYIWCHTATTATTGEKWFYFQVKQRSQ
jgi:hypothetical protein